MKTLTAYYSRSGNTKKVAEAISKAIGSDLEEITEPRGRGGLLGFLRSGSEARGEKTSNINPPKNDPANYDLLIVGTPIWAGNLSSPVRAYLARVAGKTKRVAYFVTLAGDDYTKTIVDMEKIAGHSEATLTIRQTELKNPSYIEKVNKFVDSIKRIKNCAHSVSVNYQLVCATQ